MKFGIVLLALIIFASAQDVQTRILEAPKHNTEGNRDSSYYPL